MSFSGVHTQHLSRAVRDGLSSSRKTEARACWYRAVLRLLIAEEAPSSCESLSESAARRTCPVESLANVSHERKMLEMAAAQSCTQCIYMFLDIIDTLKTIFLS